MEQVLQTLLRLGGDVLYLLNSVPPEVYIVILASLPFSVLVAFVKTFVQRKWDKVPSETKMFLINFAGILMMAVGAYLNMTPETDPAVAIAGIVGVTAFVQQPFFFRFVKPFMKSFWTQWDNSKGLNNDLTSAAVPESGLPIEK